MTNTSPSVGRIVLTTVDPRQNNGSSEAPAVITRVWNDEMVNLKVFLDSGDTLWKTSVKFQDKAPEDDDESLPKSLDGIPSVAYWPPRK